MGGGPRIAIYLVLLLFSSILLWGLFDAFGQSRPDLCEMSYMWPNYRNISVPSPHSHRYNLFRYVEGRPKHGRPLPVLSGAPVLFVHGHAGSYKQVRSIASECSRIFSRVAIEEYHDADVNSEIIKGKAVATFPTPNELDFFAVDFLEEWSAFSGELLEQQAEFTNNCVKRILSLYHTPKQQRPRSVIIVAHSMGGIVARILPILPNYEPGSVRSLITLSSPHSHPPVLFDPSIQRVYTRMMDFWGGELDQFSEFREEIVLVSITGGSRDTLVSPHLVNVVGGPHVLVGSTASMDGVWIEADHQSIVWCNQVIKVLSRALFGILRRGSDSLSGLSSSGLDEEPGYDTLSAAIRLQRLSVDLFGNRTIFLDPKSPPPTLLIPSTDTEITGESWRPLPPADGDQPFSVKHPSILLRQIRYSSYIWRDIGNLYPELDSDKLQIDVLSSANLRFGVDYQLFLHLRTSNDTTHVEELHILSETRMVNDDGDNIATAHITGFNIGPEIPSVPRWNSANTEAGGNQRLLDDVIFGRVVRFGMNFSCSSSRSVVDLLIKISPRARKAHCLFYAGIHSVLTPLNLDARGNNVSILFQYLSILTPPLATVSIPATANPLVVLIVKYPMLRHILWSFSVSSTCRVTRGITDDIRDLVVVTPRGGAPGTRVPPRVFAALPARGRMQGGSAQTIPVLDYGPWPLTTEASGMIYLVSPKEDCAFQVSLDMNIAGTLGHCVRLLLPLLPTAVCALVLFTLAVQVYAFQSQKDATSCVPTFGWTLLHFAGPVFVLSFAPVFLVLHSLEGSLPAVAWLENSVIAFGPQHGVPSSWVLALLSCWAVVACVVMDWIAIAMIRVINLLRWIFDRMGSHSLDTRRSMSLRRVWRLLAVQVIIIATTHSIIALVLSQGLLLWQAGRRSVSQLVSVHRVQGLVHTMVVLGFIFIGCTAPQFIPWATVRGSAVGWNAPQLSQLSDPFAWSALPLTLWMWVVGWISDSEWDHCQGIGERPLIPCSNALSLTLSGVAAVLALRNLMSVYTCMYGAALCAVVFCLEFCARR